MNGYNEDVANLIRHNEDVANLIREYIGAYEDHYKAHTVFVEKKQAVRELLLKYGPLSEPDYVLMLDAASSEVQVIPITSIYRIPPSPVESPKPEEEEDRGI